MSGPNVLNPTVTTPSATLDKRITFDQITSSDACEGGAFDSALRSSFGYSRVAAAFTTSTVVRGGEAVSVEAVFPNEHDWTPQAADAWDNPATPAIEQAPPEWFGRKPLEPNVGFPWHWPRKLATNSGASLAYMKTWEPSGSLDWLADFRFMGGFPVTCVWVAVNTTPKRLLAVANCVAQIRMWPGIRVHATYRGRFYQRNAVTSKLFLERFASRVFDNAASVYSSIRAIPVLNTFSGATRYTTYADIESHLAPVTPAALNTWTVVPYDEGPPEVLPYIKTTGTPVWQNNTMDIISGIQYVAVYGVTGGGNELMWIHTLPSLVDLDVSQRMLATGGIRFYLETE